tara:strand:- start:25 stop:405 length:381 start_codon:yes stop_codon:yes gene_type:complete
MKNFKNNYRRNRYRNNGSRSFHKNDNDQKLNSDFSNNSNFRRRNPGRNNQNASKLVEKYTSLAKEALSNDDKILSENYFQYAEHFIRMLDDQEKIKNDNQKKVAEPDKEAIEENTPNIIKLNPLEK